MHVGSSGHRTKEIIRRQLCCHIIVGTFSSLTLCEWLNERQTKKSVKREKVLKILSSWRRIWEDSTI